jgi:hypothetical protein
MPVKFIATCVEETVAKKFKEFCKDEGISQYGRLAELIEAYVEALEEQKKNFVRIIKKD